MATTDTMITFFAGLSYGLSSTLVGHPFDTVKTLTQALPSSSSHSPSQIATTLWKKEGARGLYRGAAPLFLAGGVIRSCQFGFFDLALRQQRGPDNIHSPRLFNTFDHQVISARREARAIIIYRLLTLTTTIVSCVQVIIAGFCGGLGRAICEAPADYIKTRRQVDSPWQLNGMLKGTGVTFLRNSFLFASFAVYSDLSMLLVPGGLSPFFKGAVCANLAWLTIWPLDVVKSQIQSGNYKTSNIKTLLSNIYSTGALFKGLVPGLARSTVANGVGMVVFTRAKAALEKEFGTGRASTF